MTVEQIASAVLNHLYSGTAGLNSNIRLSIEQLVDEVIAERNIVLREYLLKGVLNLQELYSAINCVEVNCDYMSKCCDLQVGEKALHFEIPPIVYLNGINTVRFIGSIDRNTKYIVYTDDAYRFHKHRKHGSNKPYVYLDTTINANGNIDGYIFNAPFVKYISVIALFLDPRKLLEWDCCAENPDTYMDCGILSDEIIRRLTEKYTRWYRANAMPVLPNNQQPK